MIDAIHYPIMKFLHFLSGIAARNPRKTMLTVVTLSIGIFVLGLFTNFSVDVDEDRLWTPENGKPIQHSDWIDNVGFPSDTRTFYMLFHANGENVLGADETRLVFEVLDGVRAVKNYETVCADSIYVDWTGTTTCEIDGLTSFWNDTTAIFEAEVSSDEDALLALSSPTLPDGTPASQDNFFGYAVRDESGLLVSAQSISVIVHLPDTDAAEDFESDALDWVLDLDNAWKVDPSINLRVEVTADRSFGDEFTRAIVADIPLVPIVFIIMSIFTCAIFFKRDKVRSQSLMGFNAVVSVLLSITSGYGLLFVCDVPFTSMTQILPFVIFGVGLDDAFILSGAYSRTDHTKTPVERVHATIEDVGVSITLTTLTSTLAFALGTISEIPAVYWLCQYAFPTIMIVFLYQLTYFVASMVLDDERARDGRRDCCTCIRTEDHDEQRAGQVSGARIEKLMVSYGNFLMSTPVKITIIAVFMALFGSAAYSASQLTQEFRFTDVLPSDSYAADWQDAFDMYTERGGVVPEVYFRYVDQSREDVQQQMEAYVAELQTIESIVKPPEHFWLWDFRDWVAKEGMEGLDFETQLAVFLADPVYRELHNDDIVRDASGAIVTSRVRMYMDNIDLEDVQMQIDALKDQRAVTERQPVNKGTDNWAFFTYDGIYNIWEFYAVSAEELIFTTIIGVVSVTAVALVLIPHWTAAAFVLPFICVLYIDLLGVLQWAGVHVNAVSYIAMVMSIGLLVDFIMHVLLRFYEAHGNRREKTIEMLRTMGSSIFIGGVSTFLGTLPLAFSTSEIFSTIFYTFLGLVTLGCGHGLILLPVILSMCGPEDEIRARPEQKKYADQETGQTEPAM